jgi:hypothetical protein
VGERSEVIIRAILHENIYLGARWGREGGVCLSVSAQDSFRSSGAGNAGETVSDVRREDRGRLVNSGEPAYYKKAVMARLTIQYPRCVVKMP